MTGMENTIEQAAEVLSVEGACCGDCGREPGDPLSDCSACERILTGYARALHAAGLLAPTPLREEWGTHDVYGEDPVRTESWDGKRIRSRVDADRVVNEHRIPSQRVMHRFVTDWLPVDRPDGGGRAET